jgi:hypothetical protein
LSTALYYAYLFLKKMNAFKSKFILQEINMAQYVIRSTVLCTRLIGHQFKANDIFSLSIVMRSVY